MGLGFHVEGGAERIMYHRSERSGKQGFRNVGVTWRSNVEGRVLTNPASNLSPIAARNHTGSGIDIPDVYYLSVTVRLYTRWSVSPLIVVTKTNV